MENNASKSVFHFLKPSMVYKINQFIHLKHNFDMEERKLNEKESLELIAQMISSARQNTSKQPRHSKERYLALSAELPQKAWKPSRNT